LPLRVRSACNVYAIHDLVPLGLPFTTQDNKRQLFRLLKKIAREADHIVTVSVNSKQDIIDLLGVEEKESRIPIRQSTFPKEWIERPEAVIENQPEGNFGTEFNDYLLFTVPENPKKCPPSC